MQNANDFAKTTANIPALANHDIQLNDPFCVAVSLAYISKHLSTDFPNIKLVFTTDADYNSYMTLYIPADTDFEKLDYEHNLSVNNDDSAIKLDNDTYAFYVNFPDLSDEFDIDVDTFPY
jgi:hypothetical protein